MPVSSVNSASASFSAVPSVGNESYATSVIASGGLASVVADGESARLSVHVAASNVDNVAAVAMQSVAPRLMAGFPARVGDRRTR